MNYKKSMRKIMEQLQGYKTEIDEIAVTYTAEEAKYEKELKDMEGKYTENFISEARQSWTPKTNYKGLIDLAREAHGKVVESCLDKLKGELDAYFQIPVDPGFASTISAIKTVGVTLNNREFELLQEASGGYWGRRLLNELGTSRTTPEQRTVLENGEPKAIEGERKTPYTYADVPDIESTFERLQNLRNTTWLALDNYCGMNNELADVIFPLSKSQKITNEKLRETYNVELPKQTRDAWTISRMVSAKECFDENHRAYTEFAKMMDSLEATIPKPKKKEILTDNEKTLIDRLIDPNYPTLAQDEAVKLARLDEHLGTLLLIDPRYSGSVRAALALGEDGENE